MKMKNFDHVRAFAESQFKKQERQFSVSQKATAEPEAAVNANTARLRALRLAGDAGSVQHDCTSASGVMSSLD
jgi:hypothetical protein